MVSSSTTINLNSHWKIINNKVRICFQCVHLVSPHCCERNWVHSQMLSRFCSVWLSGRPGILRSLWARRPSSSYLMMYCRSARVRNASMLSVTHMNTHRYTEKDSVLGIHTCKSITSTDNGYASSSVRQCYCTVMLTSACTKCTNKLTILATAETDASVCNV